MEDTSFASMLSHVITRNSFPPSVPLSSSRQTKKKLPHTYSHLHTLAFSLLNDNSSSFSHFNFLYCYLPPRSRLPLSPHTIARHPLPLLFAHFLLSRASSKLARSNLLHASPLLHDTNPYSPASTHKRATEDPRLHLRLLSRPRTNPHNTPLPVSCIDALAFPVARTRMHGSTYTFFMFVLVVSLFRLSSSMHIRPTTRLQHLAVAEAPCSDQHISHYNRSLKTFFSSLLPLSSLPLPLSLSS